MKKLLFAALLLVCSTAQAQQWTVTDGGSQAVYTYGMRLISVMTLPDSASGVLTFTGNSADGDTYTINATVYTTETGTVSTAYEVNDAATAALFIVNLCAAINADGAGDGTDYSAGTVAHPDVTCTASDATTLTVTAITGGSAQNTLATTTTAMNAAWGGATLVDVADPTCTVSPVSSISETEHSHWTESVTDTEPMRSAIEVENLYYLVTCASGDARVEVVP
jgi:hypothetical protein